MLVSVCLEVYGGRLPVCLSLPPLDVFSSLNTPNCFTLLFAFQGRCIVTPVSGNSAESYCQL